MLVHHVMLSAATATPVVTAKSQHAHNNRDGTHTFKHASMLR
ncbi:putative protein OS=Tsukamurella paurometabola (strain ATCC 8368 / DSM / CCUG 35730 /CIP 100753 / JCM 10117 / KCTC 9821 / NBRC 16120 / NCIMB 702349/ NCTC 13040) OX=521096 GN=Tpau_0298 PE=4 SV=1 [Tsukamurella paurometabola]|uniref:Uncharacterized protein n=1 Tax=Tsukamurella paurometabola (strain ATCC 8368 / DSM 20162 / CCUG 35730 / CIP 100753 / JCM 10117 / KCTC 9821 / NBRC 16120 / NCIMB 702349 / NCTC 13040) TaxID=521096 RepID=D5UQW1_TSUPD|nr:hypothetical protein Tpau_0298 [Tsukamurella paurometabola DSM 20162]SUP42296.1 Uncharacterised protein [Tsukamurella paurometabola]